MTEGRVLSSHGEWDKQQQRYEDGCKSGTPEHVEPGRSPSSDAPVNVCRCRHSRASHTAERTGDWLRVLGPNTPWACNACTCNRYKEVK